MSDLDLYDDLDDQNEEEFSEEPNIDQKRSKSRPKLSDNYSSPQSPCTVYIGNLTWWTTDLDLIKAMKSLGVNDIEEIKFYENKGNGQSKGFCIVTLGSDNSRLIVLEKLPAIELHGQNPVVTVCSKQNLYYFESLSKKEGQGGRHEKFRDKRTKDYDNDSRDTNNRSYYNKSRQWNNRNEKYSRQQQNAHSGSSNQAHQSLQVNDHHSNPQPGYNPWPPTSQVQMPPQVYPGPPPINASMPLAPPGLPVPPNLRLPPPKGHPMGPRIIPPPDIRGPPPPPGLPQNANPPHFLGPHEKPIFVPNAAQRLPPPTSIPGSQVNPPFYHQQPVPTGLPPVSKPPEMYNQPPPAQFSRSVNERGDQYCDSPYRSTDTSSVSETEFEEIMSRNRSVSSNAISRAISDASSGDFANAVETLVTAISLIKQSKIGNDERCKILINSVQDTLHGIESKLYRSRSKDRSNSRERERSRERPSRREKSSRRDRSRSRDREYRDRSRDRDRYHDDRYRDKDRDHRSSRR